MWMDRIETRFQTSEINFIDKIKSSTKKIRSYYRPKRSFGQGNIFTPVCHSFCSQGWVGIPACLAGQSQGWVGIPACLAGQSRRGGSSNFFGGGVSNFPEYGQHSAGTHPTGMHSCFTFVNNFVIFLVRYNAYAKNIN